MKWLKRLLGIKPEPKLWYWECKEPGCDANGFGTQDHVFQESTHHLIENGHVVVGGEVP